MRSTRNASGLLDYDDLIDRTSHPAGRSRCRLGALQAGRWPRSPAAGRGAGHRAGAVADRPCTDRGVLRRRGGARDAAHRVRRRRSQAVDLFVPGRRRRRIRPVAPAAPRSGWRRPTSRWRSAQLDVSFRSTRPVLELVDRVFADPLAAAGVVESGQTLAHYADRAEHAGAVELWPLAPLPKPPKRSRGRCPMQNQWPDLRAAASGGDAGALDRTRSRRRGQLESRGRPLVPGDVMVLVRRRNDFARALVRALKSLGVPVAGLDRLVLTEQPAVQDLMALADALLLPQDDLTFACLLTSPLGGLSDDSLMDLAIGRGGPLWEALRAPGRRAAGLARGAGRSSPPCWRGSTTCRPTRCSPRRWDLSAGGRGCLRGWAPKPPNRSMNCSMRRWPMPHAPAVVAGVPALAAPLGRRGEARGGRRGSLVRVMTVHGAKGLQAPLVILPDTTALPPDEGPSCGQPIRPHGACADLVAAARAALRRRPDACATRRTRRRMEEHNRLLYVALTRAEDRLLVCGWQTRRGPNDECWYRLVERGFDSLPAERAPFDGLGRRTSRATATPQRAAPARERGPRRCGRRRSRCRPGPARRRLARRRRCPPNPAAPSGWRPAGPRTSNSDRCRPRPSPLAAREAASNRFRRGKLLHALLQHLPDLPHDRREAAASRLAGSARQRPARRRGRSADARSAGDPRPPGAGTAVRSGQPRRSAADRRWSAAPWSAAWWTGWRCWMTAC